MENYFVHMYYTIKCKGNMKYFILLQTDLFCVIIHCVISISNIDLVNIIVLDLLHFQMAQIMLKNGALIELVNSFVV